MRGSAKDVTKDDHICYASGMLQKEVYHMSETTI